jgi:replicative DNA helicase
MVETHNERAEQEILSAILFDNAAIKDLRDGYRGELPPLDWSHFGGRATRTIARAMWELEANGRPVTVGSVISHLHAADDKDIQRRVRQLDDQAIPAKLAALPVTVRSVLDLAAVRLARTILTTHLSDLDQRPKDVLSIAQSATMRLADVTQRRAQKRDGSAGAIIASGKHKEIVTGRPLGMRWIDDATRGLAPGQKLILASNPGGRKTSTVLNWVTRAALPMRRKDHITGEVIGVPAERVRYFMLDDSREALANWMIAQIATARLIAQGADPAELTLSSLGSVESLVSPVGYQALDWAEGIFSRMPITIRDGADDAHSLDTVVEEIRHGALHGGDTLFVIDYAQDVMVKGAKTLQERVQAICDTLKPLFTELGSKYGAKLIMTSQRPENVNAFGTAGDAGGLLGGNALFAFANYILTTRCPADEPDSLYIKKLKMRSAQRGHEHRYQVVPSNGYITNADSLPDDTVEAPPA